MASIAIHASPDLKDMKRDRDVEAFRFLLKRTKRERVHLSGRGNREGEEAAKTCNPVETSQTAECDVFVFLFLILFWWQQGVRVRRRYIPFFIDPCTALRIYSEVKLNSEGFAGGPVVMNLLANEGDTKFDPLSGKIPHAAEQLNPCAATAESESRSVVSDSATPSNSPGQNTGGGSLSLLQGIFPTQVSCIAGGFFAS